ncbi:hypothetical protein BDD43_5475 [Mucilaginibacter gracilis]|uniref:Adhesin n=1 Tax=Mucilaginibacter gracilis TaxID=423350 RepID=A0A495J951_9SPHI|nr:hypothetical protein [Mucilaginibacter gracilis]RKR85211.1 hypothetical protein BDD43_5475 [Mucilaginibacter gracilis]
MKKYFVTTIIALLAISAASAQEYKVNKSSGKLVISLPSVVVEGYSGNAIVFSSLHKIEQVDERAKGLQLISGTGFTDNTGLGISVEDKANTIEVNQVASRDEAIKILVPKGVKVSYAYNKVFNAGKVVFTNVESEIEVSVSYNQVKLENITGPVTVNAIYGAVDAVFKGVVQGPVSIVSIYSTVDVAIPVATKANLKLNSTHGDIFASSEFKVDMEKTTSDDMVQYGGNVKGKLNGGGTDFTLKTEYGKIYLRKAN